MNSQGKEKQNKGGRRVEPVEQRVKNLTFRIDMSAKDQNLYLGMALAGAAAFAAGLIIYIYFMFKLHLGDLRYAVMVVGAGLVIYMASGFVEIFRERSLKSEIITSEQVTKGYDRVTNMGMAGGQVFLAVFLMELLSRSAMPRWVPSLTAIGALICYCGCKMISDAIKVQGKKEPSGK